MILDAQWRFDHLKWGCPNHPYWKPWNDSDGHPVPDTHWGPWLPGVCWLWDLITDGAAHD